MLVFEKAPAKINLTLDILSKREDGFHEIRTILTSIDLVDQLVFLKQKTPLISLYSDSKAIPLNKDNLVFKAALLLQQKFKIPYGVKIFIKKKIPVAAGLAGGSSDAAATLRALNRLWCCNLKMDQLKEMAKDLGSDVSYCLFNRTCVALGRGEKLKFLPPLPFFWLVLAVPPLKVFTASIYEKYSFLSNQDKGYNNFFTSKMLLHIANKDYKGIVNSLGNCLEKVTTVLYPEVLKIKELMMQYGADGVLMSGSGPAVFGLVRTYEKAKRIYNSLKKVLKNVYIARNFGDV